MTAAAPTVTGLPVTTAQHAWKARLRRSRWTTLALLVFLIAACVMGLMVGAVYVAPSDLWGALLHALGIGGEPSASVARASLFLSLRVPRLLLAIEVGAVLSLAGLAMQSLFRNPLAEPALLGTASGAAFGAVVAIVFGHLLAPSLSPFAAMNLTTLAAFSAALVATFAAGALGGLSGGQTGTLILAGIAINALAWTGVGFVTYVANDTQLRSITFWNLGSLSAGTWPTLGASSLPMMLGALGMFVCLRPLNVLLLGENDAEHLGIDVKKLRRWLLLSLALAVGGAVAAVGVIAFVGLVVPNLLRVALGPDVRRLGIPTVLFGAALLVFSDMFARIVVLPAELPVGIVTSAIGTPVFIFFLLKVHGGATRRGIG